MADSAGNIVSVTLGAGKGTRMNSDHPKVLHECFGESMLQHVLRSLERAEVNRQVVVVGYEAERVRGRLSDSIDTVHQKQQLGTGHAVLRALEELDLPDSTGLLVTCGDIPGIRPERYRRLMETFNSGDADCVLLSARVDDPEGYGRLVTDASGNVERIVEEADADPEERSIDLINTGIMIGSCGMFRQWLPKLSDDNEAGEIYLTDVVERIVENGGTVQHTEVDDELEVTGINTRRDLVEFERETYRRRAHDALEDGVTVHDPERVRIGPWVELSGDVEIRGDVILDGVCEIGQGVRIVGSTRIIDTDIGSDTRVERSVLREARVGGEVEIGPYCHLRPGTTAEDRTRLGNFVELKNSTVREGANAAHLSYVGDADIGRDTNVGAGTITCNYDGYEKHRTVIEDEVFIGSNTELIAPVTVGEGAMVGAGTTVSEDVPAHSLALTRVEQEIREEWVREVWKQRHEEESL